MEFAFSQDQLLLRDNVREALARACTPAEVRRSWEDEHAVPRLWSALGALDVLGLRLSEAAGGVGLSELDLSLVMEEAGRAALPGPLLEHAAVALPLLEEYSGSPAVEPGLLRRAAGGQAMVTVALQGTNPYAPHASQASHLLLQRDGDLYLIEREDAQLRPVRSVDGSRRLCEVTFTPRPAQRLVSGEEAEAAAALALDRGAVAAAAQLLGLGRQMLDVSVEYAKARQQFGRPIGSFQAVKHLLADALLALEFARPMVYRAAYTLSTGAADRALHASMAKIYAAEAAQRVAKSALQCHGAIGYSFEYDLQLWMKRSWALAAAWGDPHWHRNRAAALVIDGAAAVKGA